MMLESCCKGPIAAHFVKCRGKLALIATGGGGHLALLKGRNSA
jgi:hypothetical protein